MWSYTNLEKPKLSQISFPYLSITIPKHIKTCYHKSLTSRQHSTLYNSHAFPYRFYQQSYLDCLYCQVQSQSQSHFHHARLYHQYRFYDRLQQYAVLRGEILFAGYDGLMAESYHTLTNISLLIGYHLKAYYPNSQSFFLIFVNEIVIFSCLIIIN